MRLEPQTPLSTHDRESMRLTKGDKVIFEGVAYILGETGSKYSYATREDDGTPGMLKLSQVSRYIPENELVETEDDSWLRVDDEDYDG